MFFCVSNDNSSVETIGRINLTIYRVFFTHPRSENRQISEASTGCWSIMTVGVF